MKKVAILLAVCILSLGAFSQTYVSGSLSVYNGAGTFSQQGQPTVEVGHTWDGFSLGVAGGVTSFNNGQAYVEIRPSFTLVSRGDFSACATIGGGYIFDSPTHFLTEVSGSICYMASKNVGLSVFAGKYYFNGTGTSSQATFIGTGITYSFTKQKK